MKYTISQFKCPECDHIIPLPRQNKRCRENGHIKDIYCPWCDKVQHMLEYKSGQPIKTFDGEEIDYKFKKGANNEST